MNLTALLADVYRRISASTAPPSDVSTRITSFLNTTHRQILGLPGMESLRDDTITFSSVNGQVLYTLPPAVAKVEYLSDRTTMIKLGIRTVGDIRESDPGLVASGPPDSYILKGRQQVAVQPIAASEMFVKSSVAGDTTQTAYLEGIRTGGYAVSLSKVLTGTTAISFGAAFADIIEVTKFYLSAVGVGTITLTSVSGAGTELARIAIGDTYAKYIGIQLYPTPTSAIVYYADYVRRIPEMVNGTDEPLIDEDFHWILVEGVLIKEWSKKDDDRRAGAERTYREGLSAFKYFMNCPADYLPSRTSGPERASRFGPYFPASRQ